jgi:hypothetical protein
VIAPVNTIARVTEDSRLRERVFVSDAGEPCAWLDVGEHGERGVYGAPAAMRRLAAAVVAAANAADLLPAAPEHGGGVARS